MDSKLNMRLEEIHNGNRVPKDFQNLFMVPANGDKINVPTSNLLSPEAFNSAMTNYQGKKLPFLQGVKVSAQRLYPSN